MAVSRRTVAVVLSDGAAGETTATALRLADRVAARGHRVTVYAREAAAGLAAGDSEVATAVAALVRRGVHGGTLDWVTDAAAAERLGVAGRQAPGVVPGDCADLWAFLRNADVVLAPGGPC